MELVSWKQRYRNKSEIKDCGIPEEELLISKKWEEKEKYVSTIWNSKSDMREKKQTKVPERMSTVGYFSKRDDSTEDVKRNQNRSASCQNIQILVYDRIYIR